MKRGYYWHFILSIIYVSILFALAPQCVPVCLCVVWSCVVGVVLFGVVFLLDDAAQTFIQRSCWATLR